MRTTRMAGQARRNKARGIAAVALLALLGAAVPGATGNTSPGTSSQLRMGSANPFPSDEGTQGPFAPKDCATPRERPARLVVRCEGLAVIVNGINWRTWGQGRAQGQGRLEFERKKYSVKLEIRRVRRRLCGDERLPMFTRVKLDFRGDRPDFNRPPRKLHCSLLDSGWTP